MQKVYLKYDEYHKPVECDFGVAYKMIYLGPFYPIMKNDYKTALIVLLTQISVAVLIFLFIRFDIAIFICIIMFFIINLLFAFNYNMIVIEYFLKRGYVPIDYQSSDLLLKKGIYFKLQ